MVQAVVQLPDHKLNAICSLAENCYDCHTFKILNGYVYLAAVGFTALYALSPPPHTNIVGTDPDPTTNHNSYLLLATIAEGLSNCQKINPLRYAKVWVAANTFRYLANLLILYLIILPISDRMMKHAAWNHHPLLGHWILLGLVAIFTVIFVVLWNYNLIHSITAEDITDDKFGVQATFVTLYLVAALYAAGHLVAVRFQSLRNKAGQKVRAILTSVWKLRKSVQTLIT